MEKNYITWKNINWFVGYNELFGKVTVKVIPYVYSKDLVSVKVLTNNKIYEGETRVGAKGIFEKHFNLNHWKDYVEGLTEDKTNKKATVAKILKVKNKLEKIFQKEIEKSIFKNEEDYIKEALEESTLDF